MYSVYSRMSKSTPCWNIWIDDREDCITVLCGHKISLYTGGPSGQRTEDCPPRRCSGTQSCPDATSGPSCPDATSGPSSPDAYYSDTFRQQAALGGVDLPDGGSFRVDRLCVVLTCDVVCTQCYNTRTHEFSCAVGGLDGLAGGDRHP